MANFSPLPNPMSFFAHLVSVLPKAVQPLARQVKSQLVKGLLGMLVLAAACQQTPTPPSTPFILSTATPASNTSTPVPPTVTATITPSPTPTPLVLVVCQSSEPTSLYFYSPDTAARSAIFEALFDGPIDSREYGYQPVILEKLPNLQDGSASVVEVEVQPGESVVDAATGAVVPLSAGVELHQIDGSRVVYAGEGSARTIQVAAAFTLKSNLRWSDGAPLTADDSIFSYNIALSSTQPSRYVLDRTARYELADARSTRWVGLPGWLDTQFFRRFWAPLPRHLYGTQTAAEIAADEQANAQPIGWGAFMVSPGGWVKGDSLTLVPNPHYFRIPEGLPRLDAVLFRFGLSPEQIVADLEAGQCDIGLDDTNLGNIFTPQLANILATQEAGQLNVQFVTGLTFEHLDFGIVPAETYERPTGNTLFADVTLRHAVAHCLDRQKLIDELLFGLSEVPTVYIPAAHPFFGGEALARYPFDPAQGQALLEAAGWVDADGDGIRQKGQQDLRLTYASGPPEDAFRQALATFIQQQLTNNCGIGIEPVFYDPSTLYDLWPKGVLFGRNFDLGAFPWRTGIEPPCDLYLTEAIPSNENPGGANNLGYSNPQFDQACAAALIALDPAQQREQHIAAQLVFAQDLPSLPLFFRFKIGLAALRVEGYQPDPTTGSDLWNIETLTLKRP